MNKQNNKKNNGFTIIELLVVVSIMVILGVIFTNILTDALRGRNKVQVINQVKQNGQVVLDQLSNEMRDADNIVCVDKFGLSGSSPKDTIVIVTGGVYTQFRVFLPVSQGGVLTTNGYIQKGTINADDVLNNNNTPSNLCTQTLIPNTEFKQPLTDIDTKNGVSLDYTKVSGINQNVFEQKGDNIIIMFNVLAGVSAGYAYDMTVADGGVPFSTSVQVRGLRR